MKTTQFVGKFHDSPSTPHRLNIINPNKKNPSPDIIKKEIVGAPPEIKEFVDMRYENGDLLFPVNMKNNDILYEIVNRIITKGVDSVRAILNTKKWKDPQDLYFSLPEFDFALLMYNKYIEEQFDVLEVQVGIHKCINCGSNKTYSFTVQLRARDEGEDTRVECAACRKSFIKK